MAKINDDDFVDEVGEMIIYSAAAHIDAHALAEAVKQTIRDRYRGEQITIKKTTKEVLQRRFEDRAGIQAMYDGQNVPEIMERFRVSRATVYRIINAHR